MSTAVIRAEERCFSVISEGNEEFGSLMLMSTGKGRAEILLQCMQCSKRSCVFCYRCCVVLLVRSARQQHSLFT
jgi:hypothetical protein